ncbi:MAG: class I SAM-dependent methyltransferase [Desulfobacterales bacterium]|nr:class I SAM-dependent methyltransferase [Desulfobacterales bacterium]MBF0398328.1 class I SAM-dependent methyltransferase [Desulfobacterales bacterium]
MNSINSDISLYDKNWLFWSDMKVFGPASRWLRYLIFEQLKLIDKNECKSLLDVGCGEGTNTFYLAKFLNHAAIRGIDFSNIAINIAKNRYKLSNLEFIHDIYSIYLDNNKYDIVVCFEVIEHVEDWKNIITRISNSANKYIMLSFPTGRMRSYEKNVGHIRNFKRGEVENFLKNKNFMPINIYYGGFPFFSPIYRELCSFTNAGSNSFTKGDYGILQKIVSNILLFCFKYLSTKHKMGDQLVGLFKKNDSIKNCI